MKLKQLHEYEDYDNDQSDPEFDQHIQSIIQQDYVALEHLGEMGALPLDPESYDASAATQITIEEWFDVVIANDTNIDNYAEALASAQAPLSQIIKHDGFIPKDIAAHAKQVTDKLGTTFTISQLAAANTEIAHSLGQNIFSREDIASNPDIVNDYRDAKDERDDPYGSRGLSRSDFM